MSEQASDREWFTGFIGGIVLVFFLCTMAFIAGSEIGDRNTVIVCAKPRHGSLADALSIAGSRQDSTVIRLAWRFECIGEESR